MVLFRNKKIHIDCFTSVGIYATDNPIQKASNFIPEWWKKLTPNVTFKDTNQVEIEKPTMRSCMGLIDLYRAGFIIPMWSDLNFKIQNNDFFYQFASNMGEINHHLPFQYNNAYKNLVHFKIVVPWYFREKTGVQFLATGCVWSSLEKMPKISLLNGVLNFKYQAMCNINGFVSLEGQPYQYNIEAGTPMMHLIPMSDKDIQLHIHTLSDTDFNKMTSHLLPYKFLRWGLHRRKILKNKNSFWKF